MKILPLLVVLLSQSILTAQQPAADKLLDQIVSHPGSYSQVCDVMSAPPDLPYRLFDLTDFAGASLSKANQKLVDGNRDALIGEIRRRLSQVDFSRKPVPPSEDPKPEENFDGDAYGCDPKALSPILLTLIDQLQGIEALPELLSIEQRLVQGIAKAKDSAEAAVPYVTGWNVAEQRDNYDDNDSEAKRDRKVRLFQARVAQRDLVMLMAKLLRGKSYRPYFTSTLETAYVKGLKAEAKKRGYDKLKLTEPPKEIKGVEVTVDPVTKIIRPAYFSVNLPYTRESRDEIRALAQKWIAEHP